MKVTTLQQPDLMPCTGNTVSPTKPEQDKQLEVARKELAKRFREALPTLTWENYDTILDDITSDVIAAHSSPGLDREAVRKLR